MAMARAGAPFGSVVPALVGWLALRLALSTDLGGRCGAPRVKALDMADISKSQVSHLCTELDERVRSFLERPIEELPGRIGGAGPQPRSDRGPWPYLWIDATYVKAREAGRIVSVAVTIAVAVDTDGRREVLGMAIGASEAEIFWAEFLRKFNRRGLAGVKLVISDAQDWRLSGCVREKGPASGGSGPAVVRSRAGSRAESDRCSSPPARPRCGRSGLSSRSAHLRFLPSSRLHR